MTFDEERAASVRFGALIRAQRESRGESMAQVAARLGIARPNYRRFEHGVHMPKLDTIVRISRALEMDPLTLVAGILGLGEGSVS